MVETADTEVEIASLRQELKMRILFQNLLLQALPLVFVGLGVTAAVVPHRASIICFLFQCSMLAVAMQWCHHGVRTMQIKAFLLEINADGQHGRWEHWLPRHRPKTLLGTRWLVSTKGVFLGLGGGMFIVDCVFLPPIQILPFVAAIGVWLIAAVLLLTNPKE